MKTVTKLVNVILKFYPDKVFTLYHREFEVCTGELGEKDWFKPYVTFKLYINKYSGFHFSCQIPNRSFNGRNPLRAILAATEVLVQRELKLDRRLGE